MEKTTVYLPRALKRALERTAQVRRMSEAELVREGIALVTQAAAPAEPRLPLFESGDSTLAERVDDALAGFGDR